jgi:hypothetical protein
VSELPRECKLTICRSFGAAALKRGRVIALHTARDLAAKIDVVVQRVPVAYADPDLPRDEDWVCLAATYGLAGTTVSDRTAGPARSRSF